MDLLIKYMNRTKRFMAVMIAALLLLQFGLPVAQKVAAASSLTSDARIYPAVGTGKFGYDYSKATADQVAFGMIKGLTTDSLDNIYFVDETQHSVYKVDSSTGVVSLYAGLGSFSAGSTPVTTTPTLLATKVAMKHPSSVTVDSSDNLYIYDGGNYRILKIDKDQKISLFAGNGEGGSALLTPVQATSTPIGNVGSMAFDQSNNLYLTDPGSGYIRKIDTAGLFTTIAGIDYDHTGTLPQSRPSGDALSTKLYEPAGISVDSEGNIYFSESYLGYNSTAGLVNKLKPTITDGVTGYDFERLKPSWNDISPSSYKYGGHLTVDAEDNLYITDGSYNRIIKYTFDEEDAPTATLVAGISSSGGYYNVGATAKDSPIRGAAYPVIGNKGQLYFYSYDVSNSENIYQNYINVIQDGYKVSFDGNGQTSGSAPWFQIQPSQIKIPDSGTMVKEHHTFSGWYTEVDGLVTPVEVGSTLPLTKSITLLAQWTMKQYNITYTAGANGKITGITEQTVNSGESGTTVTAEPEEGYQFVKWSDNSTATTHQVTNISQDHAITAEFAIKTYPVSFNTDGGSTVDTQNVDHNSYVIEPAAPTRTGYIFKGWFADAELNTPYVFDSTAITESKTIYAKWDIHLYKLTYTAGPNGSITGTTRQTVQYGGSGFTVTATPNTGFSFVKWSDGNTNPTRTDTPVTADVSVTASFAATRTVSFDSNGGSKVASISTTEGASITQPAEPTLEGYSFEGWYTDLNDAEPFNFVTTPITADIKLIAKWDIHLYNLTYTAGPNGSITGTTRQTVQYGGSGITVTATPNTGFSFVKWSDGNTNPTRTDTPVTADVSAIASFAATRTVSFDSNGGSTVASKSTAEGTSITQPAEPTLENYSFEGWYADLDDAEPFNFATTLITANITLIAKWKIHSYTLIYGAGEEGTINGASSQVVNHGDSGTEVTAVPNADFSFVRWNDGKTNPTRTDSNIKADTTYTAIFAPIYTVSFDSDGGTTIENQRIVKDSHAAEPSMPIKEGHAFAGWYVDAGHSQLFVFNSNPITSNKTVFAKWTILSYTLIYGAGEEGTIDGTPSQNVNYGDSGTEVTAVPNTDFSFVEWNDGNTNPTRTDSNIKASTTYTAIFAPIYTVSFDSDGGTTIENQRIVKDSHAAEPSMPIKDGYAFAGWYEDAGHSQPFVFNSNPITSSKTLFAKWTLLAPGEPAIQSIDASDASITISWTTVPHATGYKVFQSTTADSYGQPVATVSNTVNSYQATGLTNGVTYYYVVTALNDSGEKNSLEVSATPRSVAAAPTNVKATAGNRQAVISFDAPENNGGSEITSYRVTVLPGNRVITTTETSLTITELTNGTAYTFTVEAFNVLGYGAVSEPSNGIIPVAPSSPIGGGDVGGGGGPSTEISTNGKITVPVGRAGQVSLDNELELIIPANASKKQLVLTIEKILSIEGLLSNKEILASSVFEVLKNFTENFDKPVTITVSFDPSILKSGQTVAIFYYDEVKKVWVKVEGGKISKNSISASVNHFTKFAALVVDEKTGLPVQEQSTTDTTLEVKFSDIASHWAEANIKQAVLQGIVKGYTDGTFKPNATITRAEFAVMLMNALKPANNGAELSFSDNSEIGAWAQKAVAQAVQAGFISGFTDGSFRPNAELTRAEMAVIIANVLKLVTEANSATGFADDQSIPAWAKGAVGALKELELLSGKGANNFDPRATTTRAEALTVLLRMLEQMNK